MNFKEMVREVFKHERSKKELYTAEIAAVMKAIQKASENPEFLHAALRYFTTPNKK